MAMVSMPGSTAEKFFFTVRDDAVAEQVNRVMGNRVSLHYEEKVRLPTSCFGETRHFATKVRLSRRSRSPLASWCRRHRSRGQARRRTDAEPYGLAGGPFEGLAEPAAGGRIRARRPFP